MGPKEGRCWSVVAIRLLLLLYCLTAAVASANSNSCGVNGSTAYCAPINGTTAFCEPVERTCTACVPLGTPKTRLLASGFYAPPLKCGCTDADAPNYDPSATNEDGTCVYDALCTPASAGGVSWSCWTSGDSACASGACGAPYPLPGQQPLSSLYNRTFMYKVETRKAREDAMSQRAVYTSSSRSLSENPTENTAGPLPVGSRMEIADKGMHLMRYVRFDGLNEAHPTLGCYAYISDRHPNSCNTPDVLDNSADAVMVAGMSGGGALTIREGAKVLISIGVFNNCTNRAGQGGAIKVTSATLLLRHVTFVENSAPGAPAPELCRANSRDNCRPLTQLSAGGGAIFVEFSELDVAWSHFYNNLAWSRNGRSGSSWRYRYNANSTELPSAYGGHIAGRALGMMDITYTTFDPAPSGTNSLVSVGLGKNLTLKERDMVDVGGVLGGCLQHPCLKGQACTYLNYSLTCQPCAEGAVGLDGITCSACLAGEGPALSASTGFYTSCESCQAGQVSAYGVCSICPEGREPNNIHTACIDCPAGRTGKHGKCNQCAAGYFSLDTNHSCTKCSNLVLPERLNKLDVSPPLLDSPAVCPGGLPGFSAGICPMAGVWIQLPAASNGSEVQLPQLLACETGQACQSTETCRGWMNESVRCIDTPLHRHTGHMCSSCKAGYSKVGGICVECPGFNYVTVALSVAIAFLMSMFLLHKSTACFVSALEIGLLWDKVDMNAGCLDLSGVRKVLHLLGIDIVDDNKLMKMMIKDFGAESETELSQESTLLVQKAHFVTARSQASPTAAVGIFVFFVQTFGLLGRDASFFGLAEAFNLDAEQAAGACIAPLSYPERFLVHVICTPLMICIFIRASVPIWDTLRKINCIPAAVFASSPQRIGKIHLQRAYLNGFLYVFAPLTLSSIEALVCVDTCAESSGVCAPVLAVDMGVVCYEGSHRMAAGVAVTVLLTVVAIIPCLLLLKVRRSRKRRDASLSLRRENVDKWFGELDRDNSGTLEESEVKTLLERMGEATTTSALKRTMLELDRGGDGAISKEDFESWYHQQLTSLVSTPFDLLYGTTTSSAWWWFVQVLWLKTVIQALYTIGSAVPSFQWHVWMHVVLVVSICLMVHQQPYISALDEQVELFALVTLAGLAHIASIFKTGADWDAVYLALAVVLFLVPVLTFAGGTVYLQVQAKKKTKLEGQKARAGQRVVRFSADVVMFSPDKKTTGCCARIFSIAGSRNFSRISVVQHHSRHADEDAVVDETGAMGDRDASTRPSKEDVVGYPMVVQSID